MNIGDRIGDYEIVQALGGGVGQVYKVQNTLSGRIEAMKVLRTDLAGDPGVADRFLNEIKAQATLDHPNIAKLYAAVRTGDQLAIAMEFVDGTALSEVLQSGPLPPSTAAAWAAELLDALGYAHAHDVIHGDIKPANIMLTSGGQIKLMDFGIARVGQAGRTAESLPYMSPEQIKGGDPDARSDLYSLGVTMYEMVTGRRPTGHIEVISGIPSALSDIILMATEKDPAARFQSAEAFRAALASVFPAAAMPTRTVLPVSAAVAVAPVVIVTPSPLPHAEPPQSLPAPWVIPPASARSRRGLYMALGSVLTLGVLVAAVIEGPKLMRGGAVGAQDVPASAATAAATSAVPTPAVPTPAVPTPAVPTPAVPTSAEPTSAVPTSAIATPVAAQTATPAPVSTQAAAPVSAEASAPAVAPTPSLPSTRPIQQPVPAQYAFRPAQAPPVQTAQATPPVQAAPMPGPTSGGPPVTAATASPELKELRDRINRVAIRAAAAQAGVRSIEQGIQAQGLGLRGDIKAASIRLDYVLQEARASLQNGDVEGARNNLQYAEGTLQKLDKFLGQ